MNDKLIIIGASGHGKVIADIAVKNGYHDIVFLDDNETIKNMCRISSSRKKLQMLLVYMEIK